MQTGTHLAPDATANLSPSFDHLTSIAARSILKITRAGFQVAGTTIGGSLAERGGCRDSGSNVQTNAFLSCEHETILFVALDQSMDDTSKSC